MSKAQLLVALVVLASPVAGGERNKEAILVGASTASCSDFQKLRKLDEKQATEIFRTWMDAFLSGYNLAVDNAGGEPVSLNNPQFPDGSVRFAWLAASCKAHPEKPMFAHAVDLLHLIRSTQ